MIGVCSGIILSDELAHIGQFAVLQQYRGLGIGKALWSAAHEHIGPDRNVSVYAVPDMVDKYRNSGFPHELSPTLHIYGGHVDYTQLISGIDGVRVVDITGDIINKVIVYDRSITGLDRNVLIEEQFRSEDTVMSVALNSSEEVVGYCVIAETDFGEGGFARTDQNYTDCPLVGELLLAHCMKTMCSYSYDKLVFRFYENNIHFSRLATRLGLNKLTQHKLLFSKSPHEFDLAKVNCPTVGSFFPC